MIQIKELANPRDPFPSPGSFKTFGFLLGSLLCLLALGLWLRGKTKTPKAFKRPRPKHEALERLLEIEKRIEAELSLSNPHMLASELNSVVRDFYEAVTKQPCIGLPQDKLVTLVASSSPQNAKKLQPLLEKWEAVIYARQTWKPEERIADIRALRWFFNHLQEQET